jgi:glycosyltransferase involved in cell wall biosynthesis
MRQLRILVAHNVSGARTGGMSRTMSFIHDELVRAGHQVDYFCSEDVPARFQGRVARFAFPLLLRSHTVAAARAGRPYDLVNVHEPGGSAIARCRQAAGNPVVVAMSYGVERRGWNLQLEERRLGRESISLKTRIVYPLTSLSQSRFVLRNVDHILCKNSEDQNFLMRWLDLPQSKITKIKPGADSLYAKVAKGRDYQQMENVLFAGTWIKRKGTTDLIPAFTSLASRYPNLRLVVLGGGVSEEAILSDFPPEVRSRVRCVSTNSEEETARVFAEADVYLLPSLFEGTPLTLLEAMMSGLPIITTATCGMRDVIENDRNGLLVPIRSPHSIIEAAERLIDSPGLRTRLGINAQKEALEKYTWQRVAEPVRIIYEQLCKV